MANNAGLEGTIIIQKIRETEGSHGYNFDTEAYEDLLTSGVIDPAKVSRVALQNAGSIAGMLLTTEALVADAPDDEEAPPMPHSHGGGM